MMSRNTLMMLSLILVAISVPLILRRVPPNGFYGFRTPRTLANPTLWYEANVFSGWSLLLAGVVTALLASFCPASWFAIPDFGATVFGGPVILALAASFIWLQSKS